MDIENKLLIPPPPPVLPYFGGILPILGGYWPILPSIMDKKMGDKSFMLLTRIICSSFPWFNLFILPWVQVHSLPSSPSSSSSSSSLRVLVAFVSDILYETRQVIPQQCCGNTFGQGSKVRGHGLEVRRQGSEVKGQGSKVRGQRSRVKGQGSEYDARIYIAYFVLKHGAV